MRISLPFTGLYLDIWRSWGQLLVRGYIIESTSLHASIRRRGSHQTIWTRRLR